MPYPEFKARYNILAAKLVAKAKNDKGAAGAVMAVVKLDKEKFRLGHTKVFFRAGVGGWMEEQREDKIGSVLAWLQSGARGKASRMQFKKLEQRKLSLYACQRALRGMLIARTWKWMQLWLTIKPTLKCTQFSKYKKEYEDKITLAEANIDEAVRQCDAVVAKHEALVKEKNELQYALSQGDSAVQDIINKTNRAEEARNEVQKTVDETNKRIKAEEDLIAELGLSGGKVIAEANRLKDEIKTLENESEMAEEDKAMKDNTIHTLREEISHQEQLIAKLQKEKKGAGECRQKTEEEIQAMEDRSNHLCKVKGKLEQGLDECESI